jgi:spermidine synthase
MHKKFLLFIALGITSLIGQTVLLRELLIEVQGNEIVFSIYLSLWLLMIAMGSLLGKYLLNKRNLERWISSGFILLSILVILQFFGIRFFGNAFTIISGEMFSIGNIFLLALVILTSGCLVLGALFPLLCTYIKEIKDPVHKGYIFESIGTVIGGIFFALGILFLPHIRLLLLVGMINFIILFMISNKNYLFVLIGIFLIAAFVAEPVFLKFYAGKYYPQKLQFSRDSKYGRLDVTNQKEQLNYYWNGELFAHTDNVMYAAQMVNFVMMQNPDAQKVLLVGGMLNGFISGITKYKSLEYIDYLELDKNMIAFAPHHPDVQYIQDDPVHYLRTASEKYDVIFVDVPDPTSLLLNRYYTLEFFRLAQEHFSHKSSLLAITLNSGANFLTPELEQLNAAVWKTFSRIFPYTLVIPSIKNIFMGSDSDVLTNNVQELQFSAQEYQSEWFNATVIFERCNPLRLQQFFRSVEGKGELNTISDPVAYLSAVTVWMSILDMNISSTLAWMKAHGGLLFVLSIIVIILLSLGASKINKVSYTRIDMQVFLISLVNFVMQLVLLNLFQMQFGNVYFMIFLFTSIFMIGLTAGFIFRKKIRMNILWLYLINIVLAGLIWFFFDTLIPGVIYLFFNLLFAFLEGSILSKLLDVKYQEESIRSGSSFYFLDSIGSMVGGLIVGVLLFPVLGIKTSILVLGCLLIVNLVMQIKLPLSVSRRRGKQRAQRKMRIK